MNRIVKRTLKLIGYGCLALLLVLLAGIGYVWWHSPGTTAPIVDEQGRPVPNSIASLEEVELNGTKQWILIRGYDRTKPILLFVHGGPGSPELPMITNNPQLEKRFVVVNWDQRGAGKSYDPAVFNETFTLETFINDAADLSRVLGRRFRQPGEDSTPIYLMGHSWGSFLGIQTVQKHPELFRAYIGIGQVAHQLVGEQLSYDWVMQQAQQHHNKKQIALLTKFGRPPFASPETWMDYMLPQRSMVVEYGGSMRLGNVNKFVMTSLLMCREYTLTDKFTYMVGALKTIERLWPTVIQTNLNQTTTKLNVPVYVFQGIHDYQTPHALAKGYFDRLQAPQKQFFSFANSAHGPIFEEPDLFLQRLDEITGALNASTRKNALNLARSESIQ